MHLLGSMVRKCKALLVKGVQYRSSSLEERALRRTHPPQSVAVPQLASNSFLGTQPAPKNFLVSHGAPVLTTFTLSNRAWPSYEEIFPCEPLIHLRPLRSRQWGLFWNSTPSPSSFACSAKSNILLLSEDLKSACHRRYRTMKQHLNWLGFKALNRYLLI